MRTRTQLLAIGLLAVLVAAASLLGGVLRDRGGAVAAVSHADAGVAADQVLAGIAATRGTDTRELERAVSRQRCWYA